MRHYDSVLYPQVPDVAPWPPASGVPFEVRRERISEFVDELDCVLALWIAEAMLGVGPEPA